MPCLVLTDKLGDLDRVNRIVKLNGFVQCIDGYTGQPKVIDGASDLLAEVNLTASIPKIIRRNVSRGTILVRQSNQTDHPLLRHTRWICQKYLLKRPSDRLVEHIQNSILKCPLDR